MATVGCGCKICKAGLGDFANELVLNGESPKSVLKKLHDEGLKTSENLLKKHLSAYIQPIQSILKFQITLSTEWSKMVLTKKQFQGSTIYDS